MERVVAKGHTAAGRWQPGVGFLTYDLRTPAGRYGAIWAALRAIDAPQAAFDRATEVAMQLEVWRG